MTHKHELEYVAGFVQPMCLKCKAWSLSNLFPQKSYINSIQAVEKELK